MSRLLTAMLSSAVLVSGAALAEGPIAAKGEPYSITDNSVHARPSDLSILAFIPFHYGFGIGAEARYEFPIVPQGFIPSLNNSISIEPSFGIAYNSYGLLGSDFHIITFSPAVYGIWSFWFSEQFRAYGGFGLGYNIATASGYGGTDSFSSFYWDPVVGVFYKFGTSIAVRGEVGREAVKGGVSFFF